MITRQEVWFKVWLTLAANDYSENTDQCTAWADRCLAEFDKRFPEVKSETVRFTELEGVK